MSLPRPETLRPSLCVLETSNHDQASQVAMPQVTFVVPKANEVG